MMTKTIATLCTTALLLLLAVCPAPANAQQWQHVDELPAGPMTALWTQGDTLVAGGSNKLYFTYDGGATWDSSAVIHPALDFIEAVYWAQGRLFVGTVVDGVFSSADGGHSWQPDNNGLTGLGAYSISEIAGRGDSLYAGTYGAGVFVKKISTQSAWSPYNVGMPWGNIESLTNIDGELFAGSGSNNTVSRQAPPGDTWIETPFAPLDGSLNAFLGVIRRGGILLAAGNWRLYRSDDHGGSWTPYDAGTGFLASARFVAAGDRVIANLAKPAGLSFIQYTDDQGLSWHQFEPPVGGYGYDLAQQNGWLYSARDNGLWRIAVSTRAGEPAGERPALAQNFPNPFAGSTTIPFTLSKKGWVELAVFDATGAPVRTIWRGELPAGSHIMDFDARNLPTGLYHYRLTTEAGIISRPMLLMR